MQLNILKRAIKKRYEHSEVFPIGYLLSGGIDSSLLLLLSKSQELNNINCFFLGDKKKS